MLSASSRSARALLGYTSYTLWQNVGIFHHAFECPGNGVVSKYLEPITFRLLQDQEILCRTAFSGSGSQALPVSQGWVCSCWASSGRGLLAHLHLHGVVIYSTAPPAAERVLLSPTSEQLWCIVKGGSAQVPNSYYHSSDVRRWLSPPDWVFIFSLGKL